MKTLFREGYSNAKANYIPPHGATNPFGKSGYDRIAITLKTGFAVQLLPFKNISRRETLRAHIAFHPFATT